MEAVLWYERCLVIDCRKQAELRNVKNELDYGL